MIITLLLHIYMFLGNIKSSMAFCDTPGVKAFPLLALPHIDKEKADMDESGVKGLHLLSMEERCQRIHWNSTLR